MSVHYHPDGPIVTVTIDRPEVSNAIDWPTAETLATAMRRFDTDPDLAVAVVTGGAGSSAPAPISRR